MWEGGGGCRIEYRFERLDHQGFAKLVVLVALHNRFMRAVIDYKYEPSTFREIRDIN